MSHRSLFRLVLVLFAFVMFPNFVMAGEVLKPLASQITTPVGDVQAYGATQVPMITFGADYAEIHANGDAKVTTADSIWGRLGLNISLVLQDDFKAQVRDYLSGKSPYLRGELGMINEMTEGWNDPRVKPRVAALLTRSTGGDVVDVMPGIKTVEDWRGKRVAFQADGPHMYWLWVILDSNRMKLSDVKLVPMKNLSGKDSPAEALKMGKADIAFVISPDHLALTSGGTVGTGAEGSVKGARGFMTSKTGSYIVHDVYVVREDYYQSHRDEVDKFTRGIMKSQEELGVLFAEKKSEQYKKALKAFATIILGSPAAVADAEGMFGECTMAGFSENKKFFGEANYPRGFANVNKEIQIALKAYGVLTTGSVLAWAEWDFDAMQKASMLVAKPAAPALNSAVVAAAVTRQAQAGTLGNNQIFPTFSIYFTPEQKEFAPAQYADAFEKIATDAGRFGGAVIVINGNADPLGYLKAKKSGVQQGELSKIKQAALNLSVSRALQVRDAIIAFAKSKGISLDISQFSMVGNGFRTPKSGLKSSGACNDAWLANDDPCPPKSQAAWAENMRVDFNIVSVEAEAGAFEQL
ncbi:MAG: ABC-type nitrate/sulfonate/bicarbonate transport system, periplasmic component [Parcubacteria group bacterium GW2011_GWA2_40_23]|nr:MAG: ABC-type nitrate/sulfonate/bicarbonate transport system, periplasmic component [Parcubacteria group bacterium GW2011_GWA2_40_23]